MADGKIEFRMSDGDDQVAYISLPDFRSGEKVVRQLRFDDIIPNYKGIDVYLDFNARDELVGIEIVGD